MDGASTNGSLESRKKRSPASVSVSDRVATTVAADREGFEVRVLLDERPDRLDRESRTESVRDERSERLDRLLPLPERELDRSLVERLERVRGLEPERGDQLRLP